MFPTFHVTSALVSGGFLPFATKFGITAGGPLEKTRKMTLISI